MATSLPYVAPRYSWDLLMEYVVARWPEVGQSGRPSFMSSGISSGGGQRHEKGMPVRSLPGLLNMPKWQVDRWTARGSVNTWDADKIACLGLHVHPCRIWPTWFDDAEDEYRCAQCGALMDYGDHVTSSSTCSEKCALKRKARQRLELRIAHDKGHVQQSMLLS